MPFEVFDPKELERLRKQQNPKKYGPENQPQPQPEIERDDDRWSRRPETPTDRPAPTGGNVTILQFGDMAQEDEPRDKEARRDKK